MTREEAILYMTLYRQKLVGSVSDLDKDIEAYNMAIEALEQESMRDATPEERESIDKYIKSISKQTRVDFWNLEQEPKTGHWFVDERPESDREIICSNCEQPIFRYHKLDFDYRPKYCPNCGAIMESEDEK